MPLARPARRIPGTLTAFEFNGETYEAPLLPGEKITSVMALTNPQESCVPVKTMDMLQEWDTFGVTNKGRQVPMRLREIR